ncbi:uncharacterized protein LOC125499979 [Athalia rosae]|uniref:uncharacterized protein LOC125499979 n=1 Tax=Athalia rosae TaxID=37344 RepID=UPI0020344FDD|nr:uncharacterized protein LOC125499979 [Athalia rosae]
MERETLSESEGSISSPQNEPDINVSIGITIDSIENVSSIELMSQGSVQVLIRLEHNGIILGESPPIILDNDDEAPTTIYVDYKSIFTIGMNNEISIGAAVSTPILITAMGISNVNDDSVSRSFETSGDFDGKNKGKRTSTLKLKTATEHQGPIILGICNFDIIPLLLGEISMREELLLEIQCDNARASTMPWMILPRIIVSARILDSNTYFPGTKINFMTITVESIYNLPSSLTDDLDYKARTVIYHADKIQENVIFHGGVRTSVPDLEKFKCWQLLAHLEGYAKFTKYKLNDSVTKNVLKDEIDLKLSESEPRVQWNSMQRFWVSQSDSEVILKMIQRYNCWPFFFTASSKLKDASKQKGNESQDTFLVFQCYADVSELLYPGCK